MSKEMSVIVLGIVVVVVPFLGIPGDWKTPLFVLAGLGVALIGFLLRGEALSRSPRHPLPSNESHPFVENAAEPQAPTVAEHPDRPLVQ